MRYMFTVPVNVLMPDGTCREDAWRLVREITLDLHRCQLPRALSIGALVVRVDKGILVLDAPASPFILFRCSPLVLSASVEISYLFELAQQGWKRIEDLESYVGWGSPEQKALHAKNQEADQVEPYQADSDQTRTQPEHNFGDFCTAIISQLAAHTKAAAASAQPSDQPSDQPPHTQEPA